MAMQSAGRLQSAKPEGQPSWQTPAVHLVINPPSGRTHDEQDPSFWQLLFHAPHIPHESSSGAGT
jgi:hypothetical protein